ncbi:hypothetical protein GB883_13470, partial [Georgenia thermotolerans]
MAEQPPQEADGTEEEADVVARVALERAREAARAKGQLRTSAPRRRRAGRVPDAPP